MDVLSEVLRVVKLEGAIFYNAEFSAPWAFRSPPSGVIAPQLAPRSEKLIIFHLLTEGSGYAGVADSDRRVSLEPGDIIVFPQGDAHILGNGHVPEPLDSGKELERILAMRLSVARAGGGGEVTKFICGYLAFEPHLSGILLGCLPPVLKVHIRNDVRGLWLENSIRFAVSEASHADPGSEAVLERLSEVLFVETLRRYIQTLPPQETGWLAGARDPEVGRALALMHREPARDWTLAALAAAAGTSRSVLAERFRHFLTQTPMAYLSRWRLNLGARLLRSGNAGVAEIAEQVGYESEAAFNRAFKREWGLPPARFRKEFRSGNPSRDR